VGHAPSLAVSGAVPWIAGCASPLPLTDPPASGARGTADDLLRQSAQAHGLAAFQSISDINVRYEGEWRPLIDRVKPVLVDKPHRGNSEESLLPKVGIVAQAYTGSAGPKQVVWRRAAASDGDRIDVAV
jgi:hypothetical protein